MHTVLDSVNVGGFVSHTKCMLVCDSAGQQQNAPTASAAASEASSAPDALEQTAETPAEGKPICLSAYSTTAVVCQCTSNCRCVHVMLQETFCNDICVGLRIRFSTRTV